ncbi:DNAJ domain-containing protein [Schizosaccharomyces japonicus yFS275]|uniref:DNAJ domain-containing protein n=1 Tax=Schizosaccharomyces japonicus (strain yFS275 / FY16936) TaxID=402676 RepID=B6K6A0_SCHJY|nr:DNAJ domain-containing protein [Schizosaccharomyces japonicus yFS275]EEB09054.1 DNAJ domain-containing protein [Schizosaccharomyces japonicus yFS275]
MPDSSSPMDYYKVLGVDSSATDAEIRRAYKIAALETHPDRVPVAERETANRRFQQVNEAYYVLSDRSRRRDYDRQRAETNSTSGATGAAGAGANPFGFQSSFTEEQFRRMYNDLFAETQPSEGKPGRLWTVLGGLSGTVIGFITFNVPGALAGSVAGAKLGHIRDTHGKSVYDVFKSLPAADRARVLTEMLQFLLSHRKPI